MKKIIIYLLFFIPFLSISQSTDKKETRKEKAAREDARIKKMQNERIKKLLKNEPTRLRFILGKVKRTPGPHKIKIGPHKKSLSHKRRSISSIFSLKSKRKAISKIKSKPFSIFSKSRSILKPSKSKTKSRKNPFSIFSKMSKKPKSKSKSKPKSKSKSKSVMNPLLRV